MLNPLPRPLLDEAVRAALLEDLAGYGDLTSAAVVPPGTSARLAFRARQPGRVAGLGLVASAFAQVDPALVFTPLAADGDPVEAGATLAEVAGDARAILSAERVALNFLGHLSGVATLTAAFVERVQGTQARICCTRKTTPGLRALQKYAVRCGGGVNHRFGLGDAVLIKDNHAAVAGGVVAAIRRAKAAVGHLVKIEVEVDTLHQLEEALGEGVDAVLLDNMAPPTLRQAVAMTAGRAVLEASGTVRLDTVAGIAASGVDYISSGALTHSAPALDIGLDYGF